MEMNAATGVACRIGAGPLMVLWLALGACHSGGDDGPRVTRSLGLGAASAIRLEGQGGLWALVVGELSQGATDLNGDGDANDDVLYLYHDGDATPVSLGSAVGGIGLPFFSIAALAVGDGLVAFGVYEGDQGFTDLNGDGDAGDVVLHVYDDHDGSITNTGLAVSSAQPAIGADLVAFLVREGAQGGGDLNGDGDTDDAVLHVYDGLSRVTTNTQRAVTSGLTFHDHAFAFTTDEASAGADLNGDGDETDERVFELFDKTTGGLVHVPLAILGEPVGVGVDDWFVLADEANEESDLNGDLDTQDGVFEHVEPHLGTVVPLGLSSLETFRANTEGHELALVVQEIDGFDRNGDGDLDDSIAVLYDAATGQTHDTGLALVFGGGHPAFQPMFLGDQLVVIVNETAQGLDLNADGDLFDHVVYLVDRASGVTQNLGLAVNFAAATGGAVLCTRWENSEAEDFNSDGDQDDFVTFVLRPGGTTLENTGIDESFVPFTEDAESALLLSDESAGDLNADGDHSDHVFLVHDVATGTQRNLALAGDNAIGKLDSSGGGLLLVSEISQGRDLNGDGDIGDQVVFALQIP